MKLLGKLFFLFTVTTLVELYLLILLTRYTSIWVTITTTLICSSLGAYLARREGLRAIKQLRAAMRLEQEPTTAIIDGAMLLVAAAFLFTPGVLSDIAGLLLLIPAVRRPVGAYAQKRVMDAIEKQLAKSSIQFFSSFGNDLANDPLSKTYSEPFSTPKRFPGSPNSPHSPKRGPVGEKRGPVIDIEPE